MSLAHYIRACLADDPHFFYPITPANPTTDISIYAPGAISTGTPPTVFTRRAMVGADPQFLFSAHTMQTAATNAAFYNAAFMFEAICCPTVAAPTGDIATLMPLTGSPYSFIIDFITSGTILRFSVGNTAGNPFLDSQIALATLGNIAGRRLHIVGGTDGARSDLWVNGQLMGSDASTSGTRQTATPAIYVANFRGGTLPLASAGVSHVAGYHKYDTSLAARHHAALRTAYRALR